MTERSSRKLSVKPGLRPSTRLALTPGMRQALHLLTLPYPELLSTVAQIAADNPFLIVEDNILPPPPAGHLDPPGRSGEKTKTHTRERISPPDTPRAIPVAAVGHGNIPGLTAASSARPFSDSEEVADPKAETDLYVHLLTQIRTDIREKRERLLAEALLSELDEAGYLSRPLSAIAARLECPLSELEPLLARLQDMDPPGIFARSLEECLALQLRDQGTLDEPMERLLAHLPLLAKRQLGKLAELCKVDDRTLNGMIRKLRRLHPRPAALFAQFILQPRIADLCAQPDGAGGWKVVLNTMGQSALGLDRGRYRALQRRIRSLEEKARITAQFRSAEQLLQALTARDQLLSRIGEIIAACQAGFLTSGWDGMRPLTQRSLALKLGVHESRVSRAVSGKSMDTPHGVIPLNAFFSVGLRADAATPVAAAKRRLQQILKTQAMNDHIPDHILQQSLAREGITLARRTIAKYRRELGYIAPRGRPPIRSFKTGSEGE